MGVLFQDGFLDGFGTWPLAYIPYGGPDFGELAPVAKAVGRGDASAYYAAWIAAGDRAVAAAKSADKSRPQAERARAVPKGKRLLHGVLSPALWRAGRSEADRGFQ